MNIWGYIYSPKEFFHEVLEKQFSRVIVKFTKVDPNFQTIEKPSITLNRVSELITGENDTKYLKGSMIDIHYNYSPGVRDTTTQLRRKSNLRTLVALVGLTKIML